MEILRSAIAAPNLKGFPDVGIGGMSRPILTARPSGRQFSHPMLLRMVVTLSVEILVKQERPRKRPPVL